MEIIAMNFEEELEDVLQNIEFAIMRVYRENSALTDYEVLSAIETLIRRYTAESNGKQLDLRSLEGLSQKVTDGVKGMCEWRLGRHRLGDDQGNPVDVPPHTLEEIIACLKRIRKSINHWNKHGGRQGYLNYISNFL
jgi:hypothetical protein